MEKKDWVSMLWFYIKAINYTLCPDLKKNLNWTRPEKKAQPNFKVRKSLGIGLHLFFVSFFRAGKYIPFQHNPLRSL